jgi:capsular polysaccharide transport system permease protein
MNMHPHLAQATQAELNPSRFERLERYIRRHRWFMLFVALPSLLALVYFGFVASDQFVSESRFVVKSPNQHGSQVSTLASLVQTTGLSAGQEQTNEVIGYIRSRNGLKDLQNIVPVKVAFSNAEADRIARFPFPGLDQDKFENLYKYYQGKVSATLDNETGLAVLSVKAFTPADSQKINAGLLDLSEALVNRLNERANRQAIGEANKRVAIAESRARAARVALGLYRNRKELIDPKVQSEGIFQIVTNLTGQRAALQAQLDQMQHTTPRNPTIPGVRSRIIAVDREIAQQSGRAVGSGDSIAAKLGSYENLMLEQEFSAQNLTAASAALEQARTEASRQQFYLERVVEPDAPDKALYPKRLFSVLTVIGAASCLYLIGWMLVVGILEHSPNE